MPPRRSSRPWPPRFQQWKTRLPIAKEPPHTTEKSGVMAPDPRPASAVTGLKVEPGG